MHGEYSMGFVSPENGGTVRADKVLAQDGKQTTEPGLGSAHIQVKRAKYAPAPAPRPHRHCTAAMLGPAFKP
jgi:hypothetical protein